MTPTGDSAAVARLDPDPLVDHLAEVLWLVLGGDFSKGEYMPPAAWVSYARDIAEELRDAGWVGSAATWFRSYLGIDDGQEGVVDGGD